MNVFMQGLRRSGTTIIYDILSQDRGLDLWYEPFAMGRVAVGGGSGVQGIDLFEKVRSFRAGFCAAWPEPLDPALLNWGAPRDPALELETDLPDFCREYIRAMTARSEHTVIKCVRLFRKVRALRDIDPAARFVQLVRHPRDVAVSYMYGKDQRRRDRFADPEVFFARTNDANPWSSKSFFDLIVERDGLQHLRDVPNWQRYLLLWKYTFEHAYGDGRAAFGEAFFLLRHEDLVADPRGTTRRLYAHIGVEAPEAVVEWAAANVRPSEKETFADDPRWEEAYDRIGMHQALDNAGYGHR